MGSHQSDVHEPVYDRSALRPGIAHFGVGNFHRSHQAMYLDRLLAAGESSDWGIFGIGVMPGDTTMRDALASQDYLYTLVEKSGDGGMTAMQIGSICGFLLAQDDPNAVVDLLASPDIRIVSLTITEGGYNIDRVSGEFNLHAPAVQHDLAHPQSPTTVFGLITAALRRRRDNGVLPFTVMSCDNLPENGHVARHAILAFAAALDPALAVWIDEHVTFPNSMVDRITPVTTDADRAMVQTRFGISDRWPVVTEPFCQWVLEDEFCNGRPAYETVGVQLVPDVAPYELMKLRLLNGCHQAMAYIGLLCGHTYVHEAVADQGIKTFLHAFLLESRATLAPVPGIDLDSYIATLFERFSNAAIADTLARLAVDASDRIPKFVLPTIRDNLAAHRSVTCGAAVVAHWRTCLARTERVNDALAEVLIPLASHHDPMQFICYEPVFGDLANSAEFVAAYLTAVEKSPPR